LISNVLKTLVRFAIADEFSNFVLLSTPCSRKRPNPRSSPTPPSATGRSTVERPLRLHSQLTVKAIETLRFASGDEDLRATLYEEFGDDSSLTR
jgi:hypothetical protein